MFFLNLIDIICFCISLIYYTIECYLQNMLPFLGPLVRKSSEMYRNCSVVRSLRQSENLQVSRHQLISCFSIDLLIFFTAFITFIDKYPLILSSSHTKVMQSRKQIAT